MTTKEMAGLVRQWFQLIGDADGPLLPDGWFGGRRGEAGGVLLDVEISDDHLVIHLSQDTKLTFDRPGRVFVENSDLVFDGYRKATLCWKDYGGGEDAPYHQKFYDHGQIRLAAPLGTKLNSL